MLKTLYNFRVNFVIITVIFVFEFFKYVFRKNSFDATKKHLFAGKQLLIKYKLVLLHAIVIKVLINVLLYFKENDFNR